MAFFDKTDAVLFGKFDGAIHHAHGGEIADGLMRVPLLNRTEGEDFFRLGVGVDVAVVELVDEAGKTVDTMRIHAREGGIGKHRGAGGGGLRSELAREQHALEFGVYLFIPDEHGMVSLG